MKYIASWSGAEYEVDYDDYKYCPECGQAIKREKEDMEDE